MRFAYPYWFLLLALIPVVVLIFVRAEGAREKALNRIVSARFRMDLVSSISNRKRRISHILILLGIAIIITSLARPQMGKKPDMKERTGVDIEFMIDSSLSMSSTDISPNRFEAAKNVVSEILSSLKGDRIGLSAFTNASLRILPFTTDYYSFEYFLKLADMKVFLNNATNIEYSVHETINGFDKRSGKIKILVVLSDGEDESGIKYSLPEEFIPTEFRLYAFGIGTPEGGKLPIRSETDEIVGYMKDSGGAEVITRLEEGPLKELTGSYGGRYYKYSPGIARRFVSDLDDLKRELLEEKEDMVYLDYYQVFLVAGLLLLITGKVVAEE